MPATRRHRFSLCSFVAAALLCPLLIFPILPGGVSIASADTSTALLGLTSSLQQQQRQHYLAARDALRRGQLVTYREYRNRLHAYPLSAYLDYLELNRRLTRLPYRDLDSFLNRHSNSYLGDKLLQRWLLTLARKARWQDYLNYYQPHIQSIALTCSYLHARLKTGDNSAMSEVEPLWNVGFSQPSQCTPVFKQWIDQKHLTHEVSWQRFNRALQHRSRTLARYISKLLSPKHKRLAKLYLEVDTYPHRIRQRSRFSEQSKDMQRIILHGLNRYARQDPLSALYEWYRYDAQQLFDNQQRFATQQNLAIRLIKRGHQQAAATLVAKIPQLTSDNLTEYLIRGALKRQDWQQVYTYLQHLPPPEQQSERWIYWRARAMTQLDLDDPAYPTPQQIYTQLALQRGFYAFLSADLLGREYQLRDNPVNPAPALITAIANHPASLRVREYLAVRDIPNARREWLHMSNQFTREEEHIAAAKLAQRWGWHQKTIQSMASAQSWDDLQLRFPLGYNKQVFAAAQRQRISPLLLFAITRQESAFAADAKSSAGALGLMQLMPKTALYTARKAGMHYRKHELLQPDKNITLGSVYITELLDRFDGNRVLASAAYNAGPHRVEQWLKSSAEQLPSDIWIETIPFRETRKYVQNILAYSVIYGYRTGTTPNLLTQKEARRSL